MGAKKKKKKDWKRYAFGKNFPLQKGSSSGGHIVRPNFVNTAISNFDILNWITHFRFKNFNGVFQEIKYRIISKKVIAL